MTGVVGKLIGELIKAFSNTQAGQEFVDSAFLKTGYKWFWQLFRHNQNIGIHGSL